MSDTPRTDAVETYQSVADRMVVGSDFAKKLERELKSEREHLQQSDRELCQLQDALGCPCEMDAAQEKAMHRIRDLIAAEGELGDIKAKQFSQLDDYSIQCAKEASELNELRAQQSEDRKTIEGLREALDADESEHARVLIETRNLYTASMEAMRTDLTTLRATLERTEKYWDEAVNALRQALIPLAVLKVTDEEKPYPEICQMLRESITRGHDAIVEALQRIAALEQP